MISKDDLEFFAELTKHTVEACKVVAGEVACDGMNNELGFDGYRPGRDCYPAIWIQDFTMIYAAGFISRSEGVAHLKLILETQNGEETIKLENNAIIPPYAIADHINYDKSPVFYPGTYSSGKDQGGEPWGVLPPYNNYYDVIWLAEMLAKTGDAKELLLQEINGKTICQRLQLAFDGPRSNPETGICYTDTEKRAVGFIFCDSIYMTGNLLMASLKRRRAALHMAYFADLLGLENDKEMYMQTSQLIENNIEKVFDHPSGWLKAATGISAQPDVWGTAYAVYTGALSPERSAVAVDTIAAALKEGQIEFEGAFRHVPLNHDFSDETPWEKTETPKNHYQNGAYWHMPTGWLIECLKNRYPKLAQDVWDRFIAHMKQNAFTKGGHFKAPVEFIGWDHNEMAPLFGPSTTMPYYVLVKENVFINS